MKTKSKPNPKSYNEGANDERDAVLAHVRRRKHKMEDSGYHGIACEFGLVEKWLLGRAKRYNKAKGGLGRK